MKTFKVRVTGADRKSYWYADRIDQIFDVKGTREDRGYQCVGEDIEGERAEDHYIDKSDCVIVEDNMKEFKVGDRVRVKNECVGKNGRHHNDGGVGTAQRSTL